MRFTAPRSWLNWSGAPADLGAYPFRGQAISGRVAQRQARDAVDNMTVIDAIYRAAGLPLRYPT
ncbi:hypothetical protein MAHJHV51_54420 [Mycobacterium avium subsp. hominissuis]